MTGLHSLTRHTFRPQTRVGRGGKRGKTSGRGTKGQNARAGRKKRPELRDTIKKLPKRRGYGKNRSRTTWNARPRKSEITLGQLEKAFASGDTVTPEALAKQFPKQVSAGRGIKILATGTLTKKLTIRGCAVSAGAKSMIEKAGGTIS
jgi:large subunit ribosomal protein L15